MGSGKTSPNPQRVSAISKLRAPKTKGDLSRMLGLFNCYREYVPEYPKKVRSLGPNEPSSAKHDPMEREDTLNAVTAVIRKLLTLTAPDPSKEFLLTTDMSK